MNAFKTSPSLFSDPTWNIWIYLGPGSKEKIIKLNTFDDPEACGDVKILF